MTDAEALRRVRAAQSPSPEASARARTSSDWRRPDHRQTFGEVVQADADRDEERELRPRRPRLEPVGEAVLVGRRPRRPCPSHPSPAVIHRSYVTRDSRPTVNPPTAVARGRLRGPVRRGVDGGSAVPGRIRTMDGAGDGCDGHGRRGRRPTAPPPRGLAAWSPGRQLALSSRSASACTTSPKVWRSVRPPRRTRSRWRHFW